MNHELKVRRGKDAPPRTPAEEVLVKIYSMALQGIYPGVHDSISELVEPELNWLKQCMQLIFHVEVTSTQLQTLHTIDDMVNHLSDIWGGREIVEEIAWTYLQVEELSDEDVRVQLNNERLIHGYRENSGS